MSTLNEVDTIIATLGQEKASALFSSILPHIVSRSQGLLESLQAQDWERAAEYAHKILSTANLLSSRPLTQNLIAIERCELNLLQQAQFPQIVARQLASSIDQLHSLGQDYGQAAKVL